MSVRGEFVASSGFRVEVESGRSSSDMHDQMLGIDGAFFQGNYFHGFHARINEDGPESGNANTLSVDGFNGDIATFSGSEGIEGCGRSRNAGGVRGACQIQGHDRVA